MSNLTNPYSPGTRFAVTRRLNYPTTISGVMVDVQPGRTGVMQRQAGRADSCQCVQCQPPGRKRRPWWIVQFDDGPQCGLFECEMYVPGHPLGYAQPALINRPVGYYGDLITR